MYITPDRFRTMGFGMDLDGIEDVELRSILNRASAMTDTFCAVPILPQKHDFRGGSIVKEQHNWRLGAPYEMYSPGQRRVYPNHAPIVDLTSFVVKFTNTYEVTVDPANIYMNQMQNWFEVVSIAAIVTGVYPVGINFGLYSPIVEINYDYGYDFASIGEEIDDTDGQTYRAMNQWWRTDFTPVVYINGVIQVSGYTIDYNEGAVTFSSNLPDTDTVEVDYHYKLPPAIAEGTALFAKNVLADRESNLRGMAGISNLTVAEVSIKKAMPINLRWVDLAALNPEAAAILNDYVFQTIRG